MVFQQITVPIEIVTSVTLHTDIIDIIQNVPIHFHILIRRNFSLFIIIFIIQSKLAITTFIYLTVLVVQGTVELAIFYQN